MYELNKSDYKAVLDLVTSLVSVKSISAFAEMVVNAKELIGFDNLNMSELIFHKSCTHKLVFTDDETLMNLKDYTIPPAYFTSEKVFSQILSGQEVIKLKGPPAFIDDMLGDVVSKEKMEEYHNTACHLFIKLNKETMSANLIMFNNRTETGLEKFDAMAGYLHAHLIAAFVRIMSVREPMFEKLSERELSVMTWLKHGKTSWEVAKILNITENTVNFHIKNIKRKLNATNRQHAVAIAIAKGIIE